MIRFGRKMRHYGPPRAKPATDQPAASEPDSSPLADEPQPLTEGSAQETEVSAHESEAVAVFEAPHEERFFSEAEASAGEAIDSLLENDTAPPTMAPLTLETPSEIVTPAFHLRQRKLRHAVVGTLGASLALLLLGVVSHRHRSGVATGVAVTAVVTVPGVPTPSSIAIMPTAATPTGSASSIEPPPAVLDASVAKVLPSSSELPLRTARRLLATGHLKEGVAAAREALEQTPEDAEPYILLAAGLQDLGDWAGAQAVFSACQKKAKRGPNASCRYFLGRHL